MILFLKLLLAHFIGDFFLQPDKWVADKELKKHKSRKLYWHVLLHFALIMLLVWDISFAGMAIAVSLIHGITDFLKLRYQNNKNRRMLFFADQLIHVLVLALATFIWLDIPVSLENIFSLNNLLILTGFIFLSEPCSIIVKTFISKWTDFTQVKSDVLQTVSLQNAGKIIGILERFLVFIFILVQHWEAVGFLITAKSVFRFSDLKQAQDRKLTEYILIGTLSSFGMAIVTAIVVRALMSSTL